MQYDEFLDGYLKEHRAQILADLFELIRIPSVKGTPEDGAPFGKEVRRTLDTAERQMRALGFSPVTPSHAKYGYCDLGSGEKTLGMMPHLDIVPIQDGWMHDALDPILWNGYVVGRGASDDKGGAIISMYAMDAVARSGAPLKNKIRLIWGCNEETGMQDVAALKADGMAPDFTLVPDAFFAIGVGHKGRLAAAMRSRQPLAGILSFEGGDPSGMAVPDAAVCTLPGSQPLLEELRALVGSNDAFTLGCEAEKITLTAHGIAAHPAMPFGSRNAVWLLADALSKLKSISAADAAEMAKIAKMCEGCLGSGMGIEAEDALSGKLTCVCVRACTEENGQIVLRFNIRFCVSIQGAQLESDVAKAAEALDFDLIDSQLSDAHLFPVEHPLIPVLQNAYQEATGTPADLYVHPGGTYAALLGQAVIYGNEFRKDGPFGAERGKAHQVDEATSIDDLMASIRIYFYSLLALDQTL